jgi:Flp pilus assembly protein TadD
MAAKPPSAKSPANKSSANRPSVKRNTRPTPTSGSSPKASLLQWCATHENLAFLILSTLWVFALYGRALTAPFIYDDLDQIVNNPGLASWHATAIRFLHAPVSFTNELRGIGGSSYRPLYWITLALDHSLWGLNPACFHLTNLLLHLANGFLGFLLLRKLRLSLAISAVTALLWLSLPINSEVVTWVSARAYSLSGIFLLLSLLMALWHLRTNKLLPLLFYFAFSLCALLSHEQGILILPLTLLVAYAAGQSPRRAPRSWIALAGIEIVATAIYVALKLIVGAHAATGAPAIKAFGLAFWRYVQWMILPVHMSVERSTSVPPNIVSAATAAAWIALIALAAIAIALRKKLPIAAFGLAWLIISLVPFCGLAFIYQGMAERFEYIASAGLVLSITSIALAYRKQTRDLTLIATALWMTWGVWRLEARVRDWCDPVALYQNSLKATPNSASLYFNLGFSTREKGDLETAEHSYLEAIRLQPQYQRAYASLGDVYASLGKTAAAINAYHQALVLKPDDVGTTLNFAVALQQAGMTELAEPQFRQAIALAPKDSAAYTDLGVLLYQQGRSDEAATMFAQAIDNKSTDPTPYYDLATLLQQAGRSDLALLLYKKALEIKPGDPDTIANIQRLQNAH